VGLHIDHSLETPAHTDHTDRILEEVVHTVVHTVRIVEGAVGSPPAAVPSVGAEVAAAAAGEVVVAQTSEVALVSEVVVAVVVAAFPVVVVVAPLVVWLQELLEAGSSRNLAAPLDLFVEARTETVGSTFEVAASLGELPRLIWVVPLA